jgi:hypothetical protein
MLEALSWIGYVIFLWPIELALASYLDNFKS